VLARQATEVAGTSYPSVIEGVARGAYVVEGRDEPTDAVVIATGSEVGLARRAREELAEDGIRVRVVSMPCRDWFEAQDREYRDSVLPPDVARVAVEAASSFGWRDLVGSHGEIVSIDDFGLSASAEDALAATGMTVEVVVAAVRRALVAVGV